MSADVRVLSAQTKYLSKRIDKTSYVRERVGLYNNYVVSHTLYICGISRVRRSLLEDICKKEKEAYIRRATIFEMSEDVNRIDSRNDILDHTLMRVLITLTIYVRTQRCEYTRLCVGGSRERVDAKSRRVVVDVAGIRNKNR